MIQQPSSSSSSLSVRAMPLEHGATAVIEIDSHNPPGFSVPFLSEEVLDNLRSGKDVFPAQFITTGSEGQQFIYIRDVTHQPAEVSLGHFLCGGYTCLSLHSLIYDYCHRNRHASQAFFCFSARSSAEADFLRSSPESHSTDPSPETITQISTTWCRSEQMTRCLCNLQLRHAHPEEDRELVYSFFPDQES